MYGTTLSVDVRVRKLAPSKDFQAVRDDDVEGGGGERDALRRSKPKDDDRVVSIARAGGGEIYALDGATGAGAGRRRRSRSLLQAEPVDENEASYAGGGRAENAEDFAAAGGGDVVAPTDAPNPEERRTSRVKLGPDVAVALRWPAAADSGSGSGSGSDSAATFETVTINEAQLDAWVTLRGITAFEPMHAIRGATVDVPSSPTLTVEVLSRGYVVDVGAFAVKPVTEANVDDADEVQTYVPCQIDPAAHPDAIFAFAVPNDADAFDVDVSLCSRGYAQSLTIYEDGTRVRTAASPKRSASDPPPSRPIVFADEIYSISENQSEDATCGLGDVVNALKMRPGRTYRVVVDGEPGTPYGSFRGGGGVRIKRADGRGFGFGAEGGRWDAAVDPKLASKAVRAVGTTFVIGALPKEVAGNGDESNADACAKPFSARSIHWSPYDRVGVVNADP